MRTGFARNRSVWPWAVAAFFAVSLMPQPGSLFGQGSSQISIESRLDKSKIHIGDVVRYSVIITRSPEIEVKKPGLAANLGGFEIRDYQELKPVKREGRIVERVDYLISTFEIGEFEIPPLTISYRAVGDSVWKSLQSETLRLVVESMKPSEQGDIRDIKSPLEIPRDWFRTLAPWAAGVLLLGLVAAGVQFYRWRKAGKALIPKRVEPPRPPHEIALEELAALRNSPLLEEGAYKEFFIRLSEIVRRYLEGRFYIDAMEMTTFEVLGQLRQVPDLETADIELITQFLGFCDLVKFAKYQPTQEEVERTVAEAEEIVRRTRIATIAREEEQEPEGSPPPAGESAAAVSHAEPQSES